MGIGVVSDDLFGADTERGYIKLKIVVSDYG